MDELAARLPDSGYERVRWLGGAAQRAPERVLRSAAACGTFVADQRVLWHGRYELLRYHREQTISFDYHRYGHLGWKSLEPTESTRAHAASEAIEAAPESPALVEGRSAEQPGESAA
jgi:RHH-type proline utilization regulon transcriptional repressor/proline dehydrogenase/delta 1-pyrroline-5-carboxylate dehydrogenase